MKKLKHRFVMFTLVLIIACTYGQFLVSAEAAEKERPVYVGDIIYLQIQGNVSEEEIKEAFHEFELVSIDENADGYQVGIRTFETGKKTVQINGTRLNVEVASTLDTIDRDEIYEVDIQEDKQRNTSYLYYVLGALAVGFLIFTSVFLWLGRQRKKKKRTSYERFMDTVRDLNLSEKQALNTMTKAFKHYLEDEFKVTITGMTSKEIAVKFYNEHIWDDYEMIIEWFRHCDQYKYKKEPPTKEVVEELRRKLLELGEYINNRTKEEA